MVFPDLKYDFAVIRALSPAMYLCSLHLPFRGISQVPFVVVVVNRERFNKHSGGLHCASLSGLAKAGYAGDYPV